jgi:hypothetical protein
MDTPGIGTMLGAAGACPEIDLKGNRWKIGHPTQRAKAVLEELAVAKAVAEIRRLKGILPPDAYAETFAELTSRIAAGDYRTWGGGWQRVVLAPGNSHLFLLSLLREHHPQASEDDARALALGEPEQVGAALARVVPGFFSLLLDPLPLQETQRAEANRMLEQLTANNQHPETRL